MATGRTPRQFVPVGAALATAVLGVTGCGHTGRAGAVVTSAAAAHRARPTTVTIAAVGDTDLGTTGDLAPSPATYLDGVRSVLRAEIGFFNLEGTLGTGSSSKCAPSEADCYAFQGPPSDADVYRADGFTVANSANNHSHDYGALGVEQTSAALHSAGIVQAGLPGQIGVVRVGSVKVAFVDFAPYTSTNDLLDQATARQLIRRAKRITPVVVVYMHAGAEGAGADHVTGQEEHYLGEDRGNPERFAHAAVDDGASAVIASGPHVLRGMQFYRGHLIAYSLGDFAGYENFATDGVLGLSGVLHLRLSPKGAFVRASWTSVRLDVAGRPSVDPAHSSAAFVNALSRADFGAAAAVISPTGTIEQPAS